MCARASPKTRKRDDAVIVREGTDARRPRDNDGWRDTRRREDRAGRETGGRARGGDAIIWLPAGVCVRAPSVRRSGGGLLRLEGASYRWAATLPPPRWPPRDAAAAANSHLTNRLVNHRLHTGAYGSTLARFAFSVLIIPLPAHTTVDFKRSYARTVRKNFIIAFFAFREKFSLWFFAFGATAT